MEGRPWMLRMTSSRRAVRTRCARIQPATRRSGLILPLVSRFGAAAIPETRLGVATCSTNAGSRRHEDVSRERHHACWDAQGANFPRGGDYGHQQPRFARFNSLMFSGRGDPLLAATPPLHRSSPARSRWPCIYVPAHFSVNWKAVHSPRNASGMQYGGRRATLNHPIARVVSGRVT